MSTFRLHGTVTSPYVRRVRIVAHELGLTYDLVDARSDEGQTAMRAINPLWKVPAVELDGRIILDSRVITEYLMRYHGPAPLAPTDPNDVTTQNLVTVIDGALDACINTFYLGRDGIAAAPRSYMQKQHDRTASAMQWLDTRVQDVWLTESRAFGLPEIALCTMLGWMRFRSTYPVEDHPALVRCLEHHEGRKSMADTQPTG
ncbi:MAG: glutathione S-transferase N-terminal domain-containing protein [Deltaproteobacteria bacterium]|nr:glutathione S-transferase N-terminal domain-containing protein [Deltaproteobacteria bacterium]